MTFVGSGDGAEVPTETAAAIITAVKAANGTEYAPLDAAGWNECEPVYLEFPGWTESTHGITEFSKLPPAARAWRTRSWTRRRKSPRLAWPRR